MTLAVPTVAAAVNRAPALIIAGAGNGLAPRAIFWRGNNHFSKSKGNRADKQQQQDSKVHPSGCGHVDLVLLQRPRRQFHSTERM